MVSKQQDVHLSSPKDNFLFWIYKTVRFFIGRFFYLKKLTNSLYAIYILEKVWYNKQNDMGG